MYGLRIPVRVLCLPQSLSDVHQMKIGRAVWLICEKFDRLKIAGTMLM